MTTSDLWTRDTAEDYDEESADMFAPEVLGPAVDALARLMRRRGEARRRAAAIATLASLVGAVVLARAVDDRDFSDEILAATADHVLRAAQ